MGRIFDVYHVIWVEILGKNDFVKGSGGGGLAFGIAFGLGPWSKSRRVPPSGPRLRRPVKEGPRARPCIYSPTGRVGLRTGVSDSPSMAQRKRPAVLAGPLRAFSVRSPRLRLPAPRVAPAGSSWH